MHPTGQYAIRCSLWQYYMIYVPKLFESSNLGPDNVNTSEVLETGAVHLIVSGISGGAQSPSCGSYESSEDEKFSVASQIRDK